VPDQLCRPAPALAEGTYAGFPNVQDRIVIGTVDWRDAPAGSCQYRYYFEGLIDEVAIYNCFLNHDQVRKIFKAERPLPMSQLTK
jgi:hypothetical protein